MTSNIFMSYMVNFHHFAWCEGNEGGIQQTPHTMQREQPKSDHVPEKVHYLTVKQSSTCLSLANSDCSPTPSIIGLKSCGRGPPPTILISIHFYKNVKGVANETPRRQSIGSFFSKSDKTKKNSLQHCILLKIIRKYDNISIIFLSKII
jgi:hypothetical protein